MQIACRSQEEEVGVASLQDEFSLWSLVMLTFSLSHRVLAGRSGNALDSVHLNFGRK